jgi:hypothetical protein
MLTLAAIMDKAGRPDEADKALQRAVDSDPSRKDIKAVLERRRR